MLFKHERVGGVPTSTGKRTSSSSGVSSARSERSDSSASLEPGGPGAAPGVGSGAADNKAARNARNPRQQRPQPKTQAQSSTRHSPSAAKKELAAKAKPTNDMLERHASKVASIGAKTGESKIKVPVSEI